MTMRDRQFNRDHLDLAHRRRGMPKRVLAEVAGISIRSLAGYFRDERVPLGPLAWGDRAKINCMPSSSMDRENWVGPAAVSDGGVCLKTACRSA